MEYEELNYFIRRTREGCTGNTLKGEMQTYGVNKWLKDFNGIGAIEAFTGFGKGFLCKMLFTRFRAKSQEPIVVIVPSYNLQKDFINLGEELQLTNYYVYVIKSYTMSDDTSIIRDSGLLLIDELHRCCGEMSEYFKNVIPLSNYKRLLGLSATLSYEHKEFLKTFGIETVFSVSITEGMRLSIVPEYSVYNVGVNLTQDEKINYIKADKYFKSYFKFFSIGTGHNAFDLMMACGARADESKKVSVTGEGIQTASSNQWAAYVSGFHENTTYKDIKTKAVMAIKNMTERENIVNKAENKVKFLIYALNKLNENNKVRNEIEERPLFSMSFIHDKEQIELIESNTLVGLGTPSAKGYYSSLSKGMKNTILDNFRIGIFNHLLTFKALDEGYDNKKLSIGFNLYYHGKILNTVQRVGRVIRQDEDNPDKQGLFIFVYCNPFIESDDNGEPVDIKPADFKKLPKIQKGMIDVNYITEQQCLEMLEKL